MRIGYYPGCGGMTGQAALPLVAAVQDEKTVKEIGAEAVSYTHLTLPTIYSV